MAKILIVEDDKNISELILAIESKSMFLRNDND